MTTLHSDVTVSLALSLAKCFCCVSRRQEGVSEEEQKARLNTQHTTRGNFQRHTLELLHCCDQCRDNTTASTPTILTWKLIPAVDLLILAKVNLLVQAKRTAAGKVFTRYRGVRDWHRRVTDDREPAGKKTKQARFLASPIPYPK